MTTTEALLVIMAEEAGEVTQAACKVLRFGKGDGDRDNILDLNNEIGDLFAVCDLLHDVGFQLDDVLIAARAKAKAAILRSRFLAPPPENPPPAVAEIGEVYQ